MEENLQNNLDIMEEIKWATTSCGVIFAFIQTMKNASVSVVLAILLCQLLQATENPFAAEAKKRTFSLECFPEKIMVGDVVYIQLSCRNISDQKIGVSMLELHVGSPMSSAKIEIIDDDKSYLFPFEVVHFRDIMTFWENSTRMDQGVIIPPCSEKIISVMSIQFPPLEDLHEPFWENLIDDIPSDGKTVEIRLTLLGTIGLGMPEDLLQQSVKCKLYARPKNEMKMIESWYKESKNNFPVRRVYQGTNSIIPEQTFKFSKILDGNRLDIIYWAVNTGNRYPSDPNAPATWQGWKELEESITPSTMRDEIHLTRIIIQYCDTKDKKVLKELKEWFDGMNEIQRTVMSKSIRDRAESSYGTVLLPLFCKIYKAIRQYDQVPIPEYDRISLKSLGLIE